MKRTMLILAVAILASVMISSCTASKGGCASSRGLVGYGNGMR
ncbi:MAG TPA: hypothetical protein VM488_15740 [Pseudobacter sp.]|nr:hypothetical protein [Pseudobacter sp.]